MAQVGLKAMERARSTMEDFCRSYFMFHEMSDCDPAELFKYLPVLMFVEAFIYQLDELNEANIESDLPLGADPFSQLRRELMDRNLLTERIENELEDGAEYWQLEQSLCRALSQNSELLIADVLRAMQLKSFDYRVLNLLLYQLRDQPVNETHVKFLTVSELLVEISDDLFDYEEDVVDNSFNLLRMFVRVYGPKEAPVMLASLISEAEQEYQKLLNLLDPELAVRYQKRCENAVKEGGSKSKHLLGSWTIPHLILDEEAYRAQELGFVDGGEVMLSLMRWSSGLQRSESQLDSLRDPLTNGDQFIEVPLDVSVPRTVQHADRVVAVLYCILLAGFAAVLILSWFLPGLRDQYLTPVLCSSNVLMFVITGALQRHLSAQVKKERRQGFLDFSERLESLVHLPAILFAIGNTALLLVLSWQPLLSIAGVPPLLLLRFILLMETLWAAALIGLYIWAVRAHDTSDFQPDAMHLLYSALQAPTSLGDLRYMDGRSLTDQQATLLRYQHENLCFLSEEVLRLQEMLGKYERSQDGSTPQVDVAHLLGAREQELRAVTAERDQLQAEIRMARSFIAEKDTDIQRVKTLNDKYVEENERLRAMLDEWSTRTAKLELALEAERLSNADLRKRTPEPA